MASQRRPSGWIWSPPRAPWPQAARSPPGAVWHHHPAVRGASQHPPSHYCDRFYLDTAVFSQDALAMLIKTVGEDRVVLGSDYPFPLGELRVGKLIRDMQGLGDAARAKLLAGNARRFLGLS